MSEKVQVVEGCPLTCSMGSSECSLKVPACHGACIGGKNQATVMDYKPGINITSFGICKRMTPPQPCVPVVLIPWLIEDKNYKINGEPVLFNTSVLSCVCGGIIRISRPR
ncbi:DUF4280 domain-containing protein [Clostridium sp. Marseille-P2415]|uniref:DUF4280 domain-containing protein n=1 Tax=Clostridium sp. Marseille-P2415 TaxID=1805471 RepID=UPI00098863DA|nr:DUF4280 domain-containing protein [Clostridium sp. Marseille-P2415]